VVANISFPCSGISHTDYVGEIPIGPARSFGIIDTPPLIGEVGTGPARACRVTETTPFAEVEMPPALGEIPQPVFGNYHRPS
jgi:hypothetical protein